MIALALLLLLAGGGGALEAGLAAFREGRYEEAARLLEEATAERASYEGLVALGLSQGRLGRLADAAGTFARAIGLDPRRPEAHVELGGVRFLEKEYEKAARELQTALTLGEDDYTRDLLASSLYLAGRTDEALAHWNVLGEPEIGSLEINGLSHTKDRVARRELSLAEGELLDLDLLRASRLRLAEVGVFDRITLRPVPLGDGKADLQVALAERHGFFRSPADLVVSTGVNAIGHRVRLQYTNLLGSGVNVGGQYRWQETRPELSLSLDWPRPLGLPAYLHLQGFRGRQDYDLDEPFRRKSHGLDLRLRRVLGGHTVGQVALRTRERTFSRPRADSPPGTIVGLEAGLEHRLVETRRQRLDASLSYLRAGEDLGSDVSYGRGLVRLGYRAFVEPPEGTSIEASVLALQALWGDGGSGMPFDEMFAPGGSREMEYPLRGRHQARKGALGRTPIGRSLSLLNVEWRRRLVDRETWQMGIVAFYDLGRIRATAVGPETTFHDVGCGLRLTLPGSPVLRLDYGHGLTDGKNALFVGLNNVF